MPTKLFSYFLCTFFLTFACIEGKPAPKKKAVTFGWGGRLGDQILDYTHAKWISYKWKIPLYFKPFDYSDQFVFHDFEKHLTPERATLFTEKHLTSLEELKNSVRVDTLYFVVHVPDSYEEFLFNGGYGLYIPVDWTDQKFKYMMRSLIAPKNPLDLIYPPKETISVALHLRTGGGFVWDTDSMKQCLPLRFPDFPYYVEQLNKLYAHLGRESLYVHIFTDSPDPESLRTILRGYFPQDNIEFGCRTEGNRHDANVLEDLFSMLNFDCLIRPMSHFSMTASHLTDFKIEFFPTHGYWENNRFVVDQVKMVETASWDHRTRQWVNKI